jgi:hypothetical protein
MRIYAVQYDYETTVRVLAVLFNFGVFGDERTDDTKNRRRKKRFS